MLREYMHTKKGIGKKTKKLFEIIYYINLDKRFDRNENIKKILKRHKLNDMTIRVSGYDGTIIDLEKMSKEIITNKGIEDAKDITRGQYGISLTPGAIGCALSHKRVWEDIYYNNINSALILEDDIMVNDNFNELIECYSKYKPKSYDILFIGYHPATEKYIDYEYNKIDFSNGTKNNDCKFIKSKRVYGLFAYIITLKGAEKLLGLFPIENQIDTEIHKGFKTHNIDAYIIVPELRAITSEPSETSRKFGTDIQNKKSQITYSSEKFSNMYETNDSFTLMITILSVILFALLINTIITFKK